MEPKRYLQMTAHADCLCSRSTEAIKNFTSRRVSLGCWQEPAIALLKNVFPLIYQVFEVNSLW